MRKKLTIALAAILLTIGVSAQNNTIKDAPRDSISLQIQEQLHAAYDVNGKMIPGQAQVFFILTDSSTVELQEVISKNSTIKAQVEREMEGMKIVAREESLGVSMNINILFTQK